MAINFNLSKLDIENLPEWWDAYEFGDYTNYDYFEAFVWRLMVLKPTRNGNIGPDEAKRAIVRNAIYEKVCGGIKIPAEFIRRMIGLETNIFPLHNDAQFKATIWRIIMDDVDRQTNEKVNF
jgi:hypothetical protein